MTAELKIELFVRHEVPFARCWLVRREKAGIFYLMHGDMTVEMADRMEEWAKAQGYTVTKLPNGHKFKANFEVVLPKNEAMPCLFSVAD